jgi:hypothetical protein
MRSHEFMRTSDGDHAFNGGPNLLQQDCSVRGPNRKQGGGITNVWPGEG